MITFSKQENGVLFTFENSDKYLYGDGTILVPFNSLAVIQDESDMITLRKSASWDIFLSGRFDTDFNYGSKEDAVDALKEALFDETGGGVTEEEVEQMIEEATSGIPSSQVIEQLRTDVNAVSGEVDTLQDDVASKADESSLTAVNDTLTAHTANTNIHVTSTDKSNWDAKQDALTAGENITISGNVISAEAGNNIIELTQEEYDALTEKDPDALYIITDAQEINMNDYATKTDLAAKADASALTAVSGDVTELSGDIDAIQGDISILSGDIDDLTINKANESVVVALQGDVTALSGEVQTKLETSDFNAYSASTDARIAEDEEVTAAALNDLAETVSGKQETLISGENIKTINNISILGAGNITVSGGGGGGDYQYYSEDTTNESATIDVRNQSLTVDTTGVYVNNDPVVTEGVLRDYVTSEDLENNYYTQQDVDDSFDNLWNIIDEKEEVIASALTELNLRVTEDEEVTAAALNDLNSKIGSGGSYEYYSEDTTVNTATIHIENTDDGTVGEVYVDGASVDISALRTEEDEDNGSMVETRSDINGNNAGIAMSYEKLVDDEEAAHSYLNVNENNISLEVNSNEVTTTLVVNDNGVTINGDAVATEPYVDAATSGKADTSAVTAVANSITVLSGAIDDKQDALSAGTGINISNNVISTSGVVMSQTVTQLVKLTQAQYDALATKDSSTLYIISD
ncbi:MAG: hypothetical protein VZR53_09640 [Prevotella sp.]|nr:hypothetical protein [Prevotella sp.]